MLYLAVWGIPKSKLMLETKHETANNQEIVLCHGVGGAGRFGVATRTGLNGPFYGGNQLGCIQLCPPRLGLLQRTAASNQSEPGTFFPSWVPPTVAME